MPSFLLVYVLAFQFLLANYYVSVIDDTTEGFLETPPIGWNLEQADRVGFYFNRQDGDMKHIPLRSITT